MSAGQFITLDQMLALLAGDPPSHDKSNRRAYLPDRVTLGKPIVLQAGHEELLLRELHDGRYGVTTD